MKSRTKGIIAVVIAVLLLGGGIGGYIMWNKPHRDIHDAAADFEMSVADLAAEFQKGAPAADKKYHEKVISLKGVVSEIAPGDSLTSVSMKGNEFCGAVCEMLPGTKEAVSKLKVGDAVTIKAFYMGFIEGEVDFDMPGDILLKKGLVVE